MIKNHFKIAFRYFKKHPSFTVINIFGLTFGFFCFFLLNAYVLKETSFDKDQERVYRLLQKTTDENGVVRETAKIGPLVGAVSNRLFDEIENYTQICYTGSRTIGNNPEALTRQNTAILDNNFLKVFDFPILEGSVEELSDNPNGIILTKSTKQRYFGNAPAHGKLLKIGKEEYPVVGVLEDFPENSHLDNLVFISSQMASEIFGWFDDYMSSNWMNNQLITYFKISPKTDIQQLGNKITQLAKENFSTKQEFNYSFSVQPIQDIHLYENEVEGEMNKNKGNVLYVNLFFWVGIFILLVACFNYAGLLNISFMDRYKEIALRQIVGAGKLNLLMQFLLESLLLISISMLLAYTALWILQPLVQKWFSTTFNLTQVPLMGMLAVVLTGMVLGILSVAYPFWEIIRTGVSTSLKNSISGGSKLPFRRLMLVFQFIAVILFITGSLVFSKQIDFMKTKELGFEKEGLITININSEILKDQFDAIKNEFLRIPEVHSVSVSSGVPGEWKPITVAKIKRTGQDVSKSKDVIFFGADEDFLNTYNIKLLEGSGFDGTPADSTKILVNKTAAMALGLESPIGQYVEIPSWNVGGSSAMLRESLKGYIVGMVEDFQIEDFTTTIRPLVITNWNNPISSIDYYSLKVKTSNWSKTRESLKRIHDLFDPATPMQLNILNERFSRFFEKDLEHFRLLKFFSVIIVLISCMGLFAMSAFVARSRTREISIRKVLGSSMMQLLYLLSIDFVKLIFISLLITSPIVWYLLQEWLFNFAYRIHFPWWAIPIAGLACLALTFLTISFQSIKIAMINPAKSLRTE